jgi:hypothetical protein
VLLAAWATFVAPQLASAQEQESFGSGLAPRMGLGFTADPDSFLIGLGLPFHIRGGASLGPLLRLGVSDDTKLFEPSVALEYAFDLKAADEPALRDLEPVIGAGLGIAYLDEDHHNHDDDDVGMLLHFNTGFDYWITESVALGSHMSFDVLPVEAVDESFIFAWQVLTTRVRF